MRRRHRKIAGPVDLDITAFMNLMIVLVPVLLINMVFAHTSVLNLNFPIGSSQPSGNQDLQLQVAIRAEGLDVSDNRGGLITSIPVDPVTHQQNFAQLQAVMKDIKARLPDHKAVTILAAPDTSYQSLVTLMDKLRSYKAVVAASLVDAELFPEISIADAPNKLASTQEATP